MTFNAFLPVRTSAGRLRRCIACAGRAAVSGGVGGRSDAGAPALDGEFFSRHNHAYGAGMGAAERQLRRRCLIAVDPD